MDNFCMSARKMTALYQPSSLIAYYTTFWRYIFSIIKSFPHFQLYSQWIEYLIYWNYKKYSIYVLTNFLKASSEHGSLVSFLDWDQCSVHWLIGQHFPAIILPNVLQLSQAHIRPVLTHFLHTTVFLETSCGTSKQA